MGGAIIQTRRFRSGPIDIEIMRTAILLSLHNSRHLPAGADPLPVGVPSDVGVLNAEGVAELFARQDHVHNHPAGLGVGLHHPQLHAPAHLVGAGDPLAVGVPVAIGVANAEGAATNLARRDHVHNHPAALGFALHHAHYARYLECIFSPGNSARGYTTGEAWLWPIQVPYDVTIDRIGCVADCDTVNIRMGIYPDNGDTPQGSALTVESGSVAIAGWGKEELTVADTVIVAGLNWVVFTLDGTAKAFYFVMDTYQNNPTIRGKKFDHVYGAFPATCPAVANTTQTPINFVRVKSTP